MDDHNTYTKVRSKQGNFCPYNDKEASNEQNMYIKVHSKQEDSGPGKVYEKTHYERIGSQEEKLPHEPDCEIPTF